MNCVDDSGSPDAGMPDSRGSWHLDRFVDAIDRWVAAEGPPEEIRILVTGWAFTRLEDPYVGLRRATGFDNLWFGPVPGSAYDGLVVACSVWIEELSHTVRCDSFASLSCPV